MDEEWNPPGPLRIEFQHDTGHPEANALLLLESTLLELTPNQRRRVLLWVVDRFSPESLEEA